MDSTEPSQERVMWFPRPKFTVRLLMIVVAFASLVIALGVWAFRPVGVRVELAPQPAFANVDHEIFDVVLADLMENKEYEPSVGGRLAQAQKSEIILGDRTSGWGSQRGYHLETWIEEKKIPAEVFDDMEARNPAKVTYVLAHYRPSNPKILVRDLAQIDTSFGFSSRFPKANGFVITGLPGYSRDGSSALVAFTFGPIPHGSLGYYFLRKTNGRWEVVERKISYFG